MLGDSRYNIYWYLTIIVPFIIMLISSKNKKPKVFILGSLISIFVTTTISMLAIDEKWSIRLSEAQTEQQFSEATADGANIIFGYILIAPFEAFFYTFLFGFLFWKFLFKTIDEKNKLTEYYSTAKTYELITFAFILDMVLGMLFRYFNYPQLWTSVSISPLVILYYGINAIQKDKHTYLAWISLFTLILLYGLSAYIF